MGIKILASDFKRYLTRCVRKNYGGEDFKAILDNRDMWIISEEKPVYIDEFMGISPGELGSQYLFNNRLYCVGGNDRSRPASEQKLLVMDKYDSERRKFERLKNKFSGKSETRYDRPRIPEAVRIQVWRRDDGKCSHCGSREGLEYDHIIPVSKGGSNTARNIELLCERCNREKSNKIQ